VIPYPCLHCQWTRRCTSRRNRTQPPGSVSVVWVAAFTTQTEWTGLQPKAILFLDSDRCHWSYESGVSPSKAAQTSRSLRRWADRWKCAPMTTTWAITKVPGEFTWTSTTQEHP